jgi:phosphoribosylglycinamide formyltransferase-1
MTSRRSYAAERISTNPMSTRNRSHVIRRILIGQEGKAVLLAIVYRLIAMGSGQKQVDNAQSTHGLTRELRLAVLISGTGRTLENLLAVTSQGALNARIGVVVSSVPGVRGLQIAESAGVPTVTLTRDTFPSAAAYSEAIYDAIAPYRPDLILLAGFSRKLVVPPHLEGRMLNIHPALLPESAAAGRGFYGDRVHAAVLASGAAESGATVHVVDNGYDTGPVVLQAKVPVLPDDTTASLAARVFEAECELYPEAIRQYVASHPELFSTTE